MHAWYHGGQKRVLDPLHDERQVWSSGRAASVLNHGDLSSPY